MRNILFIISCCIFFGCQDVIDVELPDEDPILVIDALIRLENVANSSVGVKIKASKSSSFFKEVTPAQLQEIKIKNTITQAEVFLTEHMSGTGVYEAEWEVEQLIRGDLELYIRHADQTYLAKTKYVPTVPIDTLQKGTSTLFGEEETEVVVSFSDDANRDDFYMFDFDFGEYVVTEDEFYQGKQFQFSFFYDSKIEAERLVKISILGVDKDFYTYMNQLIFQSGPDTGPFSSPATTVKGNIINITNSSNSGEKSTSNNALGYFAVCQTYSDTLMIKK